jgi:hydroxylamine reductase
MKTKKPVIKTVKKKIVKTSEKNLITKNMTFAELFEKKPEAMKVLFEAGLHCIGCHMSVYETIEQGCQAHGLNKKEIEEIVNKINKIK